MTYIFGLLSLSLFDCTFNLITSAWQNYVFANFETFISIVIIIFFLLRTSDSHTPENEENAYSKGGLSTRGI